MPSAEAAPPLPARSPYFVGIWTDAALIGGLSICVYAGIRLWSPAGPPTDLAHLAAWLTWLVNWPHFSATSQRLYGSKGNIAQYPATALLVPLLVGAGILASFADLSIVAPAFVKLFLLWSPYHFSGQTLGLTLLYARRSGFPVGRGPRLALSALIFGSFVATLLRAETMPLPQPFMNIEVPSFGLPVWPARVAEVVMFAGGAAWLFHYGLACRRDRRLHPPIVLLPAIAQFVWFVPGGGLAAFALFVPLFHSLQYLLVAWAIHLKLRLAEGRREPSRRFVVTESLRWAAVNFAGGVLLFWAIPRLAAAGGVPLGIAEPVCIAGIQIHHFFVDGVIWKLKNPRVSSPLLVNIDELVGAPASP